LTEKRPLNLLSHALVISMCAALFSLSLACDSEEGAPSCDDELVWDDDFIASDPEDLEALAAYRRVAGDLTLTGTLQRVAELGCLERVDGFLYLSQGELLDLRGLGNLSELGSLYVSQMPNLTSFEGLEAVQTLDSLTVQLSGVESFQGLLGLETVRGRVHFHESQFQTMSGLGTLRTIGGGLTVNGFMTPLSLEGLAGLESIGGNLDVQQNAGLTSMSGLTQLQSVGGELRVVNNAALTQLELPELASLGGTLSIRSNESLPNCQALAIQDQLVGAGWTGDSAIGSNSTAPCE